jgi:hypothetical protein
MPHQHEVPANLLPVSVAGALPATPQVIEESKANRFIGRLLSAAHARNAQRIALLAWDDEESARAVGSILAAAVSRQLGQTCALVVAEGIRVQRHSMDSFDVLTVPDVEVPAQAAVAEAIAEASRAYPVQFFVGPAVSEWEEAAPQKALMATRCHAALFIAPEEGLPRRALKTMETLRKTHNMQVLGIVPYTKWGRA